MCARVPHPKGVENRVLQKSASVKHLGEGGGVKERIYIHMYKNFFSFPPRVYNVGTQRRGAAPMKKPSGKGKPRTKQPKKVKFISEYTTIRRVSERLMLCVCTTLATYVVSYFFFPFGGDYLLFAVSWVYLKGVSRNVYF